jgi:ATP-dependent DNA helicase RecQ
MADTREALRALAEVTYINLAVIDEAHCVSEWGHNFRFSYLNLADNLRNYCRTIDGQSPTLLALTGTASRSVLRELLTELKIGKDNSEALIRPLNFDRNELKFHITKVNSGGDSSAVLRGILNGLPAKFNVPPGEFFQPAGPATNSGIVFTPFVNGRSHGLFAVKSAIQNAVKVPVTTYSGSAPKSVNPITWEADKRLNAQSFKDNEAPILVATKAFGMGIDKPNIRWTVHMGVPSSMEAFYQEAGRAGRDKNLAYCSLIFSEVDPEATDKALASQGTLDDLRKVTANFKKNDDDISRALFFHLNAYSGVDEEIEEVAKVLQIIGDLTDRKNVEIPYNRDTKPSIERAILRLIKTGIVDDLEVNFGSGFFTLRVPIFAFDKARQKFEHYISDAQPARLKTIVQKLDQIKEIDLSEQPIELCRLMVNFTYDVIERSRRRMLYEAILLGRNYSTDAEIRQYLLDYLQEGLGAEQIVALAEQQEIDFDAWIALFERVSTPLDAGEIRGIIIRLLETFPDHPGMLAARGIAEALVGKPDETLIRDSLLASLESARNRYACSAAQLTALVDNLVDLANSKSSRLRLPILNVIKKSHVIDDFDKSDIWDRLEVYSRTWDEKSRVCVAVMTADHLIKNAMQGAQAAISHFLELQQELN